MVNVNDPRGMNDQVKKAVDKLDEAHADGEIDDDDYDAILSCYNQCAGRRWKTANSKKGRLTDLRMSAVRAKDNLDRSLTEFESISDVNALLQTHYDAGATAASTQRGYTTALTALYEHLDDHNDWGDFPFYDRIDPIDEDDDSDKINPDEILDWDEVHTLREHASTPRDAAFIMFMAGTGLRSGAACALRVGDIHHLDTEMPTFSPNPDAGGQKGLLDHEMSEFPINDSRVYLRQWINNHHPEAPNPPDNAPLWPKIRGYDPIDRTDAEIGAWEKYKEGEIDDGDGPITADRGPGRENCALAPRTASHHIEKAAERAGIEKRVNLHAFRHACVKHLKLEHDYDWTDLRDKLAWSDGAVGEMSQYYGKLTGGERLGRLQAKQGADVEESDGPAAEPEECPNCAGEIPAGANLCPYCGADPDEHRKSANSVEERLDRLESQNSQLEQVVANTMGEITDREELIDDLTERLDTTSPEFDPEHDAHYTPLTETSAATAMRNYLRETDESRQERGDEARRKAGKTDDS